MKYIQSFIEAIEPMKPIKTGYEPVVSPDSSIKAVVFDIYGTLLISASGDIEEAEMVARNILTTFEAVNIELNADVPEETAGLILTAFAREIKTQQKIKREKGVVFPEINIKKVWRNVIDAMTDNGLITREVKDYTVTEIAFIFEILSNPVYPMPDMKHVLDVLSKNKVPMGIVSNAQFYTPICMNYFISGEIIESEKIKYFDEDITVYSYQHQKGKPDTFLYEYLIQPLKKKYGISPCEVLFVGNDMKKDISAAQKTGFKTALFAGDMRSLRMRSKDPGLFGVKPDFIITELNQLFEILTGFESLHYLN